MGTQIESLLQDLLLKYKKSLDLISKSDDDPSTPYKSKYAARDILADDIQPKLSEMRSMVSHENCDSSLTWEQKIDLLDILIYYELFRIANETDETCQAEDCLKSAMLALDHCKIDPLDARISLISLTIFIDTGFIKTYFDRFDESLSSLRTAEKIYQTFKSTDHTAGYKDYICHTTDLFSINYNNTEDDLSDLIDTIECLHTKTVYYIAQVYQKLDRPDEAASYCLLTLQRQYSSLESFDTAVWAENAAVLSQYYSDKKNDYATARHMIAAALLLMSNLKIYDDSDAFAKRCADIDRIIVCFCLHLLEKGSRLQQDDDDETTEAPPAPSSQVKHRLIEPSDKLTQLEEQFAVQPPNSFESAREIFLTGQSRILSAMKYFTLEDHASAHCECVCDYSRLFQLLREFEPDESRQNAMNKRRIKMLEDVLNQINVQYFLDYHRKFSFELAEIYREISFSKLRDYRVTESTTRSSQPPTEKNAKVLIQKASKINKLVDSAINWNNRFIDLFRDIKTKKLPSRYDEANVRPLIVAKFSIAKLTADKITYNVEEQLKNIDQAEALYNEVVEYYDSNADQRHLIEPEVSVVRQVLRFFPRKRQELLSSC